MGKGAGHKEGRYGEVEALAPLVVAEPVTTHRAWREGFGCGGNPFKSDHRWREIAARHEFWLTSSDALPGFANFIRYPGLLLVPAIFCIFCTWGNQAINKLPTKIAFCSLNYATKTPWCNLIQRWGEMVEVWHLSSNFKASLWAFTLLWLLQIIINWCRV